VTPTPLYVDEGFTPRLVAGALITLNAQLTVVTSSLLVAGMLAPVQSI